MKLAETQVSLWLDLDGRQWLLSDGHLGLVYGPFSNGEELVWLAVVIGK